VPHDARRGGKHRSWARARELGNERSVGKEVANKEVANNEWRITAAVVRDTFTLLSRVRGLQATSFALGLVAGGSRSNVKRICLWPVYAYAMVCRDVWWGVGSCLYYRCVYSAVCVNALRV